MHNFLWTSDIHTRKSYVAWSKVCKAEVNDGIGLRSAIIQLNDDAMIKLGLDLLAENCSRADTPRSWIWKK